MHIITRPTNVSQQIRDYYTHQHQNPPTSEEVCTNDHTVWEDTSNWYQSDISPLLFGVNKLYLHKNFTISYKILYNRTTTQEFSFTRHIKILSLALFLASSGRRFSPILGQPGSSPGRPRQRCPCLLSQGCPGMQIRCTLAWSSHNRVIVT